MSWLAPNGARSFASASLGVVGAGSSPVSKQTTMGLQGFPTQPATRIAAMSSQRSRSVGASQPGSAPLSPVVGDRALVSCEPLGDSSSSSMPVQRLSSIEAAAASAPLRKSPLLESVEEQGGSQAAIKQPTVQELKEQLRIERAWWEKTSAAQVTTQLDQLRKDMGAQQGTLAKLAEHILNPSGLKLSIDETPQVKAIQDTLEELKSGLVRQQEAQEIQANALREGLMDLHEQRAVISTVEAEILRVSEEGKAGLEKMQKEIELLAVESQKFGAGRDLALPAGADSKAECCAHPHELADLHTAVESSGAKALELHAQLAQEFADVIYRCDEQRIDLRQAIQRFESGSVGPGSEEETLRLEFASRLTDLEMKLQEGWRPATPKRPRADTDELSTRLEAIKTRLRTEIEKRVERSPAPSPPPRVGSPDQGVQRAVSGESTAIRWRALGMERSESSPDGSVS